MAGGEEAGGAETDGNFDRFDINADGFLSQREIKGFMTEMNFHAKPDYLRDLLTNFGVTIPLVYWLTRPDVLGFVGAPLSMGLAQIMQAVLLWIVAPRVVKVSAAAPFASSSEASKRSRCDSTRPGCRGAGMPSAAGWSSSGSGSAAQWACGRSGGRRS